MASPLLSIESKRLKRIVFRVFLSPLRGTLPHFVPFSLKTCRQLISTKWAVIFYFPILVDFAALKISNPI